MGLDSGVAGCCSQPLPLGWCPYGAGKLHILGAFSSAGAWKVSFIDGRQALDLFS